MTVGDTGAVGELVVVIRVFFRQSFVTFGPYATISPTVRILLPSSTSGGAIMTFDDVLEQVVTLLKRQGRVSYGALKRRFNLDDAYLEDLKGELLYVHEAEVEADERGFTWTGATADLQGTTSRSNQAEPQSVVEQVPTAQDISVSVNPHPPEAERRQLTVLFCDL